MQNSWHSTQKIFIAVEVIAKTPGIGPSCSIPLEHASSQAAAVTSAKNFQHFNVLRSKRFPSYCLGPGFFPSLYYFSPPYNLVDRTEEKTQLRAEGCHNNFVMACDTYLKPALPRTPRTHSPSRPGIRRHDGPKQKIPGWYRGRSKSHAGREIFRSSPCANR